MLRVDIRDLQRGPVETTGSIPADAPALVELDLALDGPVAINGKLQATGEGEYLWRGHLLGSVRTECRRCLTEVRAPFDVQVDALFNDDPDAADDPSTYPLPPSAGFVDLTEAVREELVLAAPRFVLCREDCAGLCPRCGADLNAGPCACAAPTEAL